MTESRRRFRERSTYKLDASAFKTVKDHALEIYTTMPVVRIQTIAQRTGATIAQIHKWKDEGNWLNLRAARQQSRVDELLQNADKPDESAKRNLELAKKMAELLEKTMGEAKASELSAGDYKGFADTIQRIADIQSQAYERLKIR